ncbi:class I SAM-dependent methyltransferase [Sphingomonas sp.]|uniref:class I SAM-dependent methyltransferase n=1 Tax=Sphingomonas sp. TaxID=28214 RepID=UPI003D6D82EB
MSARTILKLRVAQSTHVTNDIAHAYDRAGARYLNYADGTAGDLFDFGSGYHYGDRRIWQAIEAKLVGFAEAGHQRLTVLDAGCGPGTWLRRVVTRAHLLGIPEICATGFDISGEQIAIARLQTSTLRQLPGVRLRLEERDLATPLSEEDASIDLCLCLNGVLNHMPAAHRASVAADLARVTAGKLFVTVRTCGSQPSIFIDRIDAATDFHHDDRTDRLEINLRDGHRVEFDLHLFHASEVRALFAPHIDIIRLSGIDIFHSRFTPDPRWNPAEGAEDAAFHRDLELLEQAYAADPHFIDHATHVLMIAEPQQMMER